MLRTCLPRRYRPCRCTLKCSLGGEDAEGVLGLDHAVLDRVDDVRVIRIEILLWRLPDSDVGGPPLGSRSACAGRVTEPGAGRPPAGRGRLRSRPPRLEGRG